MKTLTPTMELVKNILAVWNQASTADMVEGKSWYATAYTYCQELADKYSLDVETCAGVVAALSPNNKWHRNMRDAEAMIAAYKLQMEWPKVCTFPKNKAKASEILQGFSPLQVLSGNKVKAFYACIMGDSESVCVDGHAYNIAHGNRVSLDDVPHLSDREYNHIAEAYAKVAKLVGQHASTIQAVTWVTWRRVNGVV